MLMLSMIAIDLYTFLTLAVFGAACMGLFGSVALAFRIRARDLRHLGTASSEIPLLAAIRPLLERLAYIASLFPRKGFRQWADAKLRQANLIRQWSAELIEVMKLLSALGAIGFYVLFALAARTGISPVLVVLIALVGYFLPDGMLHAKASGRQESMRRALPFVIDLLAVSAEAGLAFQQAVRNVVDNSARSGGEGGERELVQEFESMLGSLQMGRSLIEALTDTAKRIDLNEFTAFANAIMQAERLGTPVSEALRLQSEELRAKIASKVEEKANRAPVFILVPLIIFIFPVTAWVIVGPVLLQVFMKG